MTTTILTSEQFDRITKDLQDKIYINNGEFEEIEVNAKDFLIMISGYASKTSSCDRSASYLLPAQFTVNENITFEKIEILSNDYEEEFSMTEMQEQILTSLLNASIYIE